MTPRFVISDTHLGHLKIRDYEPMRQAWGPDTDAMTETIIAAWNSVVGSDDVVLHVGDFAMGPPTAHPGFRSRLNGRIYLVRGNHDKKNPNFILDGDMLCSAYEFTLPDGRRVLARHNPEHFTAEDARMYDILLHGHTHSSPGHNSDPDVQAKLVNVSIESLPTTPAPAEIATLLMPKG